MLKAVPSESTQEESEEINIPFQSVSEDIWDKKYRLKSKKGDFVDKDINETYGRVAKALADVEKPEKRELIQSANPTYLVDNLSDQEMIAAII
jgi:ribonucleoside-diphosphate reductase alpha chain